MQCVVIDQSGQNDNGNSSGDEWRDFKSVLRCLNALIPNRSPAFGGGERNDGNGRRQPFLTLTGAALIPDQTLDAKHILFAAAVITMLAIGGRMTIKR
jgi:hypothetical protein